METVSRANKGSITDLIDILIALILSLVPILQHYKAFFINAGWSLLLLGTPLLVLRILFGFSSSTRISKRSFILLLLMCCYYVYHLVDHGYGSGDLFKSVIILLYYCVIAMGYVDSERVRRIAQFIAVVNVCVLLLQIFSYYILRVNLQFIDLNRLVSYDYRWEERLGTTSTNLSLYRPSALFLEPSHLFLFFAPLILTLITREKAAERKTKLAFFLLSGMIFSTSGMGIVFVFAVLFVYLTMYRRPHYAVGSFRNLFTGKTITIVCLTVAVAVLLYFKVPLFHNMISRILFTDENGYNAISGRTSRGGELLSQLSRKQLIIGIADYIGDDGRALSGFQGECYKYGIIGLVLSYAYYLYGTLTSDGKTGLFLGVFLLVLSFVCAHTHKDFYMLYFSVFLFASGGTGAKAKGTRPENIDSFREETQYDRM